MEGIMHRISMLIMIICLAFSMTAHKSFAFCQGQDVAIVVSNHFGPYITAANAIERRITGRCTDIKISKFFLDQEKDISRRLGKVSPDVIFPVGTQAAMEVHGMFPGIPLIFSMVLDPPAVLVEKSNEYGVVLDIPYKDIMRFLLMLVPSVSRIGVLYTEDSLGMLDRIDKELENTDLQLVKMQVLSPEHIQERLKDVFRLSDALLAIPDMNIYNSIVAPRIIFEAIHQGKPFVGLSKNFTMSGALFSLDCDYNDIGTQAADLWLEILAGETPVKKIQYPRKFTAYLNLHTASLIGLVPDKKVLDAFKIVAY